MSETGRFAHGLISTRPLRFPHGLEACNTSVDVMSHDFRMTTQSPISLLSLLSMTDCDPQALDQVGQGAGAGH